MTDAKVNAEVLKAYIKNSSATYNLSAADIITLKNRGVPDDVLTAMLQRGGAEQGPGTGNPQVAGPQPYPAAPTPYTTLPDYGYGYDYGTGPVYYPNLYSYPDYVYGYPYSYWGWAGWPVFYGGFFFDSFGHRHYRGFDRFDRFGRGRNSFFGRGGFAGGGRAPYTPFNRTFRSGGSQTVFAPVARGFAAPRSGFASRPSFGSVRMGGIGGRGAGRGRGR